MNAKKTVSASHSHASLASSVEYTKADTGSTHQTSAQLTSFLEKQSAHSHRKSANNFVRLDVPTLQTTKFERYIAHQRAVSMNNCLTKKSPFSTTQSSCRYASPMKANRFTVASSPSQASKPRRRRESSNDFGITLRMCEGKGSVSSYHASPVNDDESGDQCEAFNFIVDPIRKHNTQSSQLAEEELQAKIKQVKIKFDDEDIDRKSENSSKQSNLTPSKYDWILPQDSDDEDEEEVTSLLMASIYGSQDEEDLSCNSDYEELKKKQKPCRQSHHSSRRHNKKPLRVTRKLHSTQLDSLHL